MDTSDTFPAPPEGMSAVAERLYQHLGEHVAAEADVIMRYRLAAEDPETPEAARYLMTLLVEDEERHHRMFRQISTAVRNEIRWTHEPEAVPSLGPITPSPSLAALTEEFLNAERTDRRELRELRRELRTFRETSLWTLLVEMMEQDTEKHIRLLTFLRDHLGPSTAG